MAISVNYYRASTNATRGSSISAFGSAGSGVFIAGTYGPSGTLAFALPTETLAISGLGLSGIPDFIGNVFAFSDTQNASAAYSVQASGSIAHYVGLTSGVLNNLSVAMGILTSGTDTASGVFVLDTSGNVANYAGGWAAVSTNAISGSAPFRYLTYDGTTNLFCIGQTNLEKLALASAISGTWSTFTPPTTANGLILDGLTLNAANPIVFGRLPYVQPDVAADIVEYPNQLVVVDASTTNLYIYTFTPQGILSLSQTLSISGTPAFAAPSLNQLLVTDTINNTLSIYDNTAGTWSGPVQILTIAAPEKIATSLDGLDALVCQPSGDSITGYSETGGVWTLGNSVSVSGAIDAVFISDIEAYTVGASGVSILDYTTGWSLNATVTLPISGNSIALNLSDTTKAYVSATSAGSGYLFLVDVPNQTYISDVWAGSADNVIYSNGYVCVLDSTNNVVRSYSTLPDKLEYSSSCSLVNGTNSKLSLGNAGRSYACGTSGWEILALAYPFALIPYYAAYLWQWSGAAWVETLLSHARINAACSDTVSAYAITESNYLFKVDSAGTIDASYPQVVTPYPEQSLEATLGISGMLILNNTIYFSSSEGGAIGAITGY